MDYYRRRSQCPQLSSPLSSRDLNCLNGLEHSQEYGDKSEEDRIVFGCNEEDASSPADDNGHLRGGHYVDEDTLKRLPEDIRGVFERK